MSSLETSENGHRTGYEFDRLLIFVFRLLCVGVGIAAIVSVVLIFPVADVQQRLRFTDGPFGWSMERWAWILGIGGIVFVGLVTVCVCCRNHYRSKEFEMSGQSSNYKTQSIFSWVNGILLVVTVIVFSGAVWAQANKVELRQGFVDQVAPPAVEAEERFSIVAGDADPVIFDHSAWDALVKKHVDADGYIDYAGMKKDEAKIDQYIAALAAVDRDELGRDEHLALLINAYNVFTVKLILEYWEDGELKSIFNIPEEKRWKHVRWDIGGKRYSLDQIEHAEIRPNFKEPRIHWAVVCAAYSCPPLRSEAYTGEKLDEQLASQETYVHTHPRWYRWDARSRTMSLTKLYEWYKGDFVEKDESPAEYIKKFRPEVAAAVKAGQKIDVKWINYDWKLNDIRYRPDAK